MSAADATAPAAAWKPAYNPWLIAVAVTLAAFMEILDTTIVNVALPHIAGSLSSSSDEADLGADLLSGRQRHRADDLGMAQRPVRPQALLHPLHRDVHGMLVPLRHRDQPQSAHHLPAGAGLLRRRAAAQPAIHHPRHLSARQAQRGVLGVTAIATIVAPVLGPTLGGYITDQASWRWIFFLNIPVGAIAVLLVSILVEDPPWLKNKRRRGIDYIGLSLITPRARRLADHDGPRRG